MEELIQEMQSAWSTPSSRHAMVVHLPVALAILGLPLSLAALLTGRRRTVKVVAVLWYLLLAGAAVYATRSGDAASARLSPLLSPEVFERAELHEWMASPVWAMAVLVALLLFVSLARPLLLRLPASLLAVAAAAFCAGWVAVVGHHGGVLVYEHGAGVAAASAPRLPAPSALADVGAQEVARTSAPVGPAPDAAAANVEAEGAAGPSEGEAMEQAAAGSGAPEAAFAANVIMPLFADRCQSCHNAARPKSRFDLTTAAGLERGGRVLKESPVVPGRPEQSALIQILRGEHPDVSAMPPDEPLSEQEIAMVERWIREGAVWAAPTP